MKYRMVGGLVAEIPHLPDKQLIATLASAKVVRSAYVRACKEDKNPSLWKIKEEWVEFVEKLKGEMKKRSLTLTAKPAPTTDARARTT